MKKQKTRFDLKLKYLSVFKLITTFLIIFSLIISSAAGYFSAEAVNFSLKGCSTDKNRLFTVSMEASYSKPLCAASFEFTYDKSMFEFRDVDSNDENTLLKAYETDDSVNVLFLNADGKEIKDGNVIFELTFKAVKNGIGYIDYYVSDCVDENVNSINAGKCTSAEIKVNSSDKSKGSTEKEGSGSSKSKSVREVSEEDEDIASIDEMGTLNRFDDQNVRFLIIGIALGVSVIAFLGIAMSIFKKFKNSKTNENNSSDS